MYQFTLFLHNILRWIVVVAALLAFLKAIQSWMGKKAWSSSDKKLGLLFTVGLDTQILLGFLLYGGLSPVMKAIWNDFGAAMQNSQLRFFAVEHMSLMILAAIAAHLGFRAGKSDLDQSKKFRAVSIWYGLAILFLLIGIPWFRPYLPF